METQCVASVKRDTALELNEGQIWTFKHFESPEFPPILCTASLEVETELHNVAVDAGSDRPHRI